MYSYTAYGLALQSDIQLPELIEAAGESACPASLRAHIRIEKIDRSRGVAVRDGARMWASPEATLLDYEDSAAYLIRGGQEILIDPVPGVDERIVRLFLLGPAIALLLHQRGYLILHASAVRIGNGAVALVGEKGAGKSTMAAALHARGHALVSDDVVAVAASSQPPLVYPGFPQLKLFPESAQLLSESAEQLPRVHPDFEKRAKRAETKFNTQALPLRAVLELADAPRASIEALGVQQYFISLVRHSYVLPLLSATGSAQAHFAQTVRVAGGVPVRKLLRPRALSELPVVAELVEQYFAGEH